MAGALFAACGIPLGLQSSVTQGIVSAMRTAIPGGNGVTLPSAIQTTAAINPGNSGGALINLNEQVVGIPTLGVTDPQMGGGAAPGIGFAIPSNTVKLIANQLVKSGVVTNSGRADLGVQVANTGGQLVCEMSSRTKLNGNSGSDWIPDVLTPFPQAPCARGPVSPLEHRV